MACPALFFFFRYANEKNRQSFHFLVRVTKMSVCHAIFRGEDRKQRPYACKKIVDGEQKSTYNNPKTRLLLFQKKKGVPADSWEGVCSVNWIATRFQKDRETKRVRPLTDRVSPSISTLLSFFFIF